MLEKMNWRIDYKTLFFIILEWVLCICAILTAIYVDRTWLYITSAIFIGSRQHGLFILFHDAAHRLFAKNERVNYLIANLFIGIPLNIPLQAYRGLHLLHHKYLGTQNDPERVLQSKSQFWNYQPLNYWKLFIQLLGDLLIVNIVISIIYYIKYFKIFATQTKQLRNRWYWETFALAILWWGFIVFLFIVNFRSTLIFILLWNIPLLTINPLLQKIRTFTEHNVENSNSMTNNWTPGFLGRVLIWPYNINLHQIHHHTPNIPWHKLRLGKNDSIPKKGIHLISYLLKL